MTKDIRAIAKGLIDEFEIELPTAKLIKILEHLGKRWDNMPSESVMYEVYLMIKKSKE